MVHYSVQRSQSPQLRQFDFTKKLSAGLIVAAGGFEERAITFASKLKKANCSIERSLLLHYDNQVEDNSPNYKKLKTRIQKLITTKGGMNVPVHADSPIQSSRRIDKAIGDMASAVQNRTAVIDISGMTHLWALTTIHSCIKNGLSVVAVYTEAKSYFPSKKDHKRLSNAWKKQEYEIAASYLQSAGLKAVQILPEFAGSFRPGRQTCLVLFAGYEPNRIKGLLDVYAPGAMIVFYGRPPNPNLSWRTKLSQALHEDVFAPWLVRRGEISTLEVLRIVDVLEEEYKIVSDQYDFAIAAQCSKMQALASYLFWRRHPEVQLLFTSPVRFNPSNYSAGAGLTYVCRIT